MVIKPLKNKGVCKKRCDRFLDFINLQAVVQYLKYDCPEG
ncbi:hypothetical protein SPSINT_2142 [Staphylococcus pseudintermedius HKU10-03]|nr:hypothetical protein SPSINT_2142 [Staphylococcus pseudintermedius HKU10-03]ADX75674.1 hypothetical protein SPSE_0330 [Staphylococcus pseudintermedius ED99]ANS88597.1 hypothetical protein A6M57_1390 [Staphylococcus pseudintermedius]